MPSRIPLTTYSRAALSVTLDRLVPSRRKVAELTELLEASRHLRNEAVERNADLAAERDAWKGRWEQASADGLRASAERDRLQVAYDTLRADVATALKDPPCPPPTTNP